MPSKKKSKPSFQVPEDLQTAPQAGWVYRSDEHAPARGGKAASKSASGSKGAAKTRKTENVAPAAETAAPPKSAPPRGDHSKPAAASKSDSKSKSTSSVLDLTAKALSAGFGTVGGLVLLSTTIVAAPFALGKRILHL